MESSFDVFLTGELAPGVDRATAVERLAEIFNLQLSVADQLVCGSSRRIKKACNKATALRFRQLLNDAGLSVSVKRHEENPHSTPPVPSPQQEQPAVFEAQPTSRSAEAPLEQSSERPNNDPLDYQPVAVPEGAARAPKRKEMTGELVMAPVGELLVEPAPEAAPYEGELHLDLAPAGAPIPNLKSDVVPLNPATEHLAIEDIE